MLAEDAIVGIAGGSGEEDLDDGEDEIMAR